MRLTIFGGTGRTGRLLVQQAVSGGHEVTILVRDPSKVTTKNGYLQVLVGDARNSERVEQAVQGAEAVLSLLGAALNRPTFEVSAATDNILAAMKKLGVRRLIMSTGAGVSDPNDAPDVFNHLMTLLLGIYARYVYEDMLRAAAKVRASNLDWTIVRAPLLTDQTGTGRLKIGYVGTGIGPRLSRADMATFMLRQLTDKSYLRQAPAISN